MVVMTHRNSGDTIPGNESSASSFEPDLPPEFCHYQDEGCRYFSSCLQCPFPDCLEHVPGGTTRMLKKSRNASIKVLFSQGWDMRELALLFGVSVRTIQRVCKHWHDRSPFDGKEEIDDEGE